MNELHPHPLGARHELSLEARRTLPFMRFPQALKGLMLERNLSYRQMAYKTQLSAGYLNHLTQGTRPVPADHVMRNIAKALHVEADFFLDFRLRRVVNRLEESTRLTDALYAILLLRMPVSDDVKRVLEKLDD